MKNVTEEQIDEIITKKFLNVNETSPQDFVDNYYLYKETLKENIECLKNNSGYAEAFFFDMAVLKTAQDRCINVLRESLKELLCESSSNKRNEKREGESNV